MPPLGVWNGSAFRRSTAAFFGCASSTVIRSNPSGALVYIDGSRSGQTPYTLTDTKIVGSSTQIRLTKEGYEDIQMILTRSEEFQIGPCIGGVFLLVPFLWVMGYKPEHTYDLHPVKVGAPQDHKS